MGPEVQTFDCQYLKTEKIFKNNNEQNMFKIMCLTMCNHDFNIIRSQKGVIGSVPKTIFFRHFENGTLFLNIR